MQTKAFDWLVLAILVAIWGSGFALLKVATEHIDPLWNSTIRTGVATVTLAGALVAQRQALPPLRHPAWRAYALIGALGMAIPLMLFAFAAQRLPSAVVAICNGASPIFTGLLAHLFIAGDRLTLRKALGVALGFAGLTTLVAPRLAAGATIETLALSAALFGALLYAICNVITRQAPAVSSTVGALLMLPLGLRRRSGRGRGVRAAAPFPAACAISARRDRAGRGLHRPFEHRLHLPHPAARAAVHVDVDLSGALPCHRARHGGAGRAAGLAGVCGAGADPGRGGARHGGAAGAVLDRTALLRRRQATAAPMTRHPLMALKLMLLITAWR